MGVLKTEIRRSQVRYSAGMMPGYVGDLYLLHGDAMGTGYVDPRRWRARNSLKNPIAGLAVFAPVVSPLIRSRCLVVQPSVDRASLLAIVRQLSPPHHRSLGLQPARITCPDDASEAAACHHTQLRTHELHWSHERKRAPATEYVEMPDGSSSAAPVMIPGPNSLRNR